MQPSSQTTNRVASIDIFRGITMIVMIFVNELAEVKHLPYWTYHAPGRLDYMTYVDMVFPFFLFIIGMSMPLSVRARLKQNPSMPALWLHIFLRSLGLVVIGLVLANADQAGPMLLPGSVWALIALLGAMLYLNVYSSTSKSKTWLRLLGLALVVIMYAMFRRTTPSGGIGWINFSYPEILGLIGFSYFATSLLYVPTRRAIWAPGAWFVLLVALNSLCSAHILNIFNHIPLYVWPFGNFSMPLNIMAGILTSTIFLGPQWPENRKKIAYSISFALICLVSAYLLTPLGVSKIRATPTWCLYSTAASVLCFTMLYWVCDMQKKTGWAFFIKPAGSNALLTYLLPDLWFFLFSALGITYLGTHMNFGLPGVLKAMLFTMLMVAISSVLTKAKVRLQL
ncbi:heparan-alpha-glucosaminide N-acetyltransferase domain-containing protein [Granulicella sibirica]|uniref:N-acetylglucosamine related transporter, NagX n=1 Tax=Granulicella sibirica TaxID=2479048 RepID=A0A4Q0T915_9BACT|nr:DUF5009 domain-containing protein [Granulicella sibirica]RXH58091.1 N-acetylglucosamine related transporter, NagX [Granulicella sibirica]